MTDVMSILSAVTATSAATATGSTYLDTAVAAQS